MNLRQSLRELLEDADTGWSMGTFGALAEFHRDLEEETVCDDGEALLRATPRGAIRLDLDVDVSAVAYETLSGLPNRWGHGIALCLPERQAAMSGRSTIAELGPDDAAVRGADRDAILFDMGLSVTGAGCRAVDFCVRTADAGLIDTLRAACGQSILDPSCPAMSAILEAHPNRIAITRLGRVEVFQPIGGPATGGVSPAGPHTHVLPKLLASERTHSANIPIPDGLVPCASAYPASAVSTAMGEDRPFDEALQTAFDRLMDAWGNPEFVKAKRQVRAAIAAGADPASIEAGESRLQRTAVRVALRQLARQTEDPQDRSHIECWRSVHDRGAVDDDPMQAEHA